MAPSDWSGRSRNVTNELLERVCSKMAQLPDVTDFQSVSGAGTASGSVSVPNSLNLMGLPVYHQWAVFDNVNSLGIVVSDAAKATVGI